MMSFILLLFFLINSSNSFPILNYTRSDCYNSSIYPLKSSYDTNLNNLLSNLVSKISTANDGFITIKQGLENQDPTYGLALCRGDIDRDDCNDCVKMASEEVTSDECPRASQAIIWKERCMLRYSNMSFFSLLQEQPSVALHNVNNVTDHVEDWTKLLQDTLSNVSYKAASVKSGNKYATKEAWFEPMKKYLYTLAQCVPSLTMADCSKCFGKAVDLIPRLFAHGGIVLTPSCTLRYEYQFYSLISLRPPPNSSIAPATNIIARTNPGKKKATAKKVAVATIVPLAVLGLLITGICVFRKKAKKYPSADVKNVLDDLITAESLMFDLRTLEVATNNFSDDHKLGQGGFGSVYKGTLANGQEIAVKRLSKVSSHGAEEFKNEVVLIANLQHRNLVKLLGFCLAGDEKLLVFEFVPNKSLNYFLFDTQKQGELNWCMRYEIIRGIARGLLYLHEDSQPRIIHRDLKSGNILLDANMNPKIADFGLARIFKVEQTMDDTSRIVGTYGYMAPEYAMHGQFSIKTDVYSFGVLVLEIVSGKKVSARFHPATGDLLTYAWRSLTEDKPLEFMDPTLKDSYSMEEVMKSIHLGLWCAQENTQARPTMSTVVHMLNNGSSINTMPIPQCPRSFLQSSNESSLVSRLSQHSTTTTSSTSANMSTPFSENQDTVSELHPR